MLQIIVIAWERTSMMLVIITSVLPICTVYHVCGTFDIMNKLYNICSSLHIFRVQGLILFIYLLTLSVLVLDATWFSSLFFSATIFSVEIHSSSTGM